MQMHFAACAKDATEDADEAEDVSAAEATAEEDASAARAEA